MKRAVYTSLFSNNDHFITYYLGMELLPSPIMHCYFANPAVAGAGGVCPGAPGGLGTHDGTRSGEYKLMHYKD